MTYKVVECKRCGVDRSWIAVHLLLVFVAIVSCAAAYYEFSKWQAVKCCPASPPAVTCSCEPCPCEECRCDGGDCGPCDCKPCNCGPCNTTIDIHITIGIDLQPPEPAFVMRLLHLPTWLLLPRIQPPINATAAADESDLVATEELPGPCECEAPPEPAAPPPIRSPPQKTATPPAAVQPCPAPTIRYRRTLLPRRRWQ